MHEIQFCFYIAFIVSAYMSKENMLHYEMASYIPLNFLQGKYNPEKSSFLITWQKIKSISCLYLSIYMYVCVCVCIYDNGIWVLKAFKTLSNQLNVFVSCQQWAEFINLT